MANNTMNFGIDLLPTTNDTFSLGSNDKKWIINGVTNPKLTDTTYSIASQSSNGLMSSDDKIKLDSISSGATTNTGTVTSITTGIGLIGGTITENGTIKIKLKSETALLNDSVTATETSGRIYPIVTDKSGYLAVNVPWTWRNISDSVSSTSSDVSASSKAVKTAYDLASEALPKTGGTMTGTLILKNNTSLAEVRLDSNSSGTHGILSSGYGVDSSYVQDRKWIAYRGSNGNIYLNGESESAEKVSSNVGKLSFNVGYILPNYSIEQERNYIQLPLSCERYIVISAWLDNSDTICLPGVYNNSAKSWYIYCYNTSNFSKHNLSEGDKIFYTYIDSGSAQFNNEIPIQ